MNPSYFLRRAAGRRLLPLAAALLLGACGENAWRDLPTAGGGNDRGGPEIEILAPDTARRVAVGDSVLVRVRVSDGQGIDSVALSGFAVRGSPTLGTDRRVERFLPKTVAFDTPDALVTDTVISRFLLAAADSLPEDTVFLVVTAADLLGNRQSDTVRIAIGGPGVGILSPVQGATVRAGTTLPVRIRAGDVEFGLESLTLRATASGLEEEIGLRFDVATPAVDTVVPLDIPGTASGDLRLVAVARSTNNDSTVSEPVVARLTAPIQDTRPPTVNFTVAAPERAERDDSVTVTVTAVDSTEVERVGITVLPTHRLPTGNVALPVLSLDSAGDRRTFRFALDQLQLRPWDDSSTVRLEITAFAVDTAGHCAASTVPGTTLAEPCVAGEAILSARAGARSDILLTRGITIAVGDSTDRVADLISDGRRVFLSNLNRHRVDVIEVGEPRISSSIAVGSRPWGLALTPNRDTLYVANSGGTNISVVSTGSLLEDRGRRILTPNVKLFDVPFTVEEDTLTGVAQRYPGSVTRFDYSDRPQYLAVTRSGDVVYSTRPTGAAPDGTIRILHNEDQRLEFVTEYLEQRPGSKVIIINADSAFLVAAEPNPLISVCPRDRSENPALDRRLGEVCIVGSLDFVEAAIATAGYDTRFLYNREIAEVGLSDTTYAAVSGDHSAVAFGEGDRENARVMLFTDPEDSPTRLQKHGEIFDIVGNAAERVIGLGLNSNGSMGVARGREAYYFSRDLRLQGVVATGSPTGGVDMHPDDPSPQRSFVSGVDENGLAYIDVIDTFHFRRTGRIFMRDPVTGPIRAVRAEGGGVILYAVTDNGVVAIDVAASDL